MKVSQIVVLGLGIVIAYGLGSAPVLAQKATPGKSSTGKAVAKKTALKKGKKAKSACAGLAKSACAAKKQCGWIQPKKKVSKNGRKLTPYCRTVAGIAKKKKVTKKQN